MSDIYGEGSSSASGVGSSAPSGTVDTAKHEASEIKDTAVQEAGNVVETGKSEVSTVAHEAVSQVKDLYSQTQRQLSDQAATQKDRVASGLRSVGDELTSLADGAENPGIGADLVRQASTRVSSVASWIGDRDPATLLDEVKSYARRKPGVFIGVAALAGLAIGRLVRALGENAKDEHTSTGTTGAAAPVAPPVPPLPTTTLGAGTTTPGTAVPVTAEATGTGYGAADPLATPGSTPVYDQSRAAWEESNPVGGARDDRSDTV
ncbi:MAG: hypothetical protein K0Q58_344 [Microbacterium sp.]|jgi:ElaB/YqjD/DUF883 family membrane-anchored ribosome-binding protein|nr:hypothetical protein [Microbacterium sp.]